MFILLKHDLFRSENFPSWEMFFFQLENRETGPKIKKRQWRALNLLIAKK